MARLGRQAAALRAGAALVAAGCTAGGRDGTGQPAATGARPSRPR
jgi:hypothetical protein